MITAQLHTGDSQRCSNCRKSDHPTIDVNIAGVGATLCPGCLTELAQVALAAAASRTAVRPAEFIAVLTAAAAALRPLGRVCGGLSIIGASPEVIAVARTLPGATYTGYGHRDRKGLGYLTIHVPALGGAHVTIHDVPAPVKLPKLTGPHRFALRALADGLPHESGPATVNGLIRGVSGAVLVQYGYARAAGGGPVRYTITDAGRAALAQETPCPKS